MPLTLRMRILSALSVLLILSSCSKTNTVGRMVPKEAGFIIHFSGKSLSAKVNITEMRQSDWFKKFQEGLKSDSNQTEIMKRFTENAKNSGIDSLGDIVFFADNSRTDTTYMVVQASIKDAGAFEKFLKNVYPQGSFNKDGAVQTMAVEDKAVISWNTEKAMFGFKSPSTNGFESYQLNDSTPKENYIPQIASYCKNLFTMNQDKSMATEDKFTDLVNTPGDIHCFVNIGKLMGSIPQMGAMSMLKMDNFIDGNISVYTMNFENGKITLRSKGYYGKEMDAVMKKYSGGTINTAMLKNIPGNNIVGVMAMHFNPEGLKELVKMSGMDGMINLAMARYGLSFDEFIKANKGDIMIAVTDLSVKKDTVKFPPGFGKREPIIKDKPDAKFIFSAAINDKEAFNKFISFAEKQGAELGTDLKISFNTNKEYFAIGNSADYISSYLAGGKNDQSWMSKISGNPIGMYVDLQKIIKAMFTDTAKDSVSIRIADASVKMWDNVILSGGNYSNGGLEQVIEVNMMDKTTNSLQQLMKYTAEMTALEKQKLSVHEATRSDSTIVNPLNRLEN